MKGSIMDWQNFKTVGLWTVLILSSLISGCGPSGPTLYTVRGKVTHNGKPMAKLYIVFQPDDPLKAAESIALTEDDGSYEMSIGSTPGVFPGEHTVTADDPRRPDGLKISTEPDYLEVIKKYGPGVSTYRVDIQKNMKDFEIKLD